MKQPFIWAATLLAVLLLTVASSCVSAATPAPAAATVPTPEANSAPAAPTASTPAPILPPTPTQRQRTNGRLTQINGDTLTLSTTQGPVTVKINSDNLTIHLIGTGSIMDLHEGGYLIAVGPQDVNGNINATSIMIRSQVRGAPPVPPEGATPANPRSPRTGARRGVSGTITKISGRSLTVTTAQGTMTVNVASDATIQESTTGTVADLVEGQSLIVLGSKDADGAVTATDIVILPPGQSVPSTPSSTTPGK